MKQGAGSMKHLSVFMSVLLAGFLCGNVPSALAEEGDCQILSSTKQVDYGRFRREDMREGSTEYAGNMYHGYASVTRELQVSVICTDEHKIRLFVDGPARQGQAWQFSDNGAMSIKMKNARVDNAPVQLASVPRGAAQVSGGAAEMTLLPDMSAAAVNGQEVAGKQWVATLMITTYLADKAFQTSNTQDLEETYTVSFDALAAN
ncbi:TPA: hypothetical protein U2I22_003955 [Citrobacter koseri]|nr:hypothetical protein [Citrobacter koseri]